jgi:aminoglycoside 6'-N-acetyltransferase I
VHYVHPDKPPELWINEVGVALPYQRQGLGSGLLSALLSHGAALGCVQAWVLTEPGNEPAQRLYRGVGGRAADEGTVLFEIPLQCGPP